MTDAVSRGQVRGEDLIGPLHSLQQPIMIASRNTQCRLARDLRRQIPSVRLQHVPHVAGTAAPMGGVRSAAVAACRA